MPLTNDLPQKRRDGGMIVITATMAASTTIYQGGLVCYNAAGLAVPAADSANFKIAGVALETKTTGSGESAEIEIARFGEFDFAQTNIAAADVGKNCFVTDDGAVTNAATASEDIPVGTVTARTATRCRVIVGAFSQVNA